MHAKMSGPKVSDRGFGFNGGEIGAQSGHAFEGIEAGFVVVDVRGDHQFVGMGNIQKVLQGPDDRFWRTNCGDRKCLAGQSFFSGRPEALDVIDGWRNLPGGPAPQVGERLLE